MSKRKPKVAIEHVSLAAVKPYSNNPRDNTKAVDVVKKSIDDYGFLVPLVLDSDYTIVCGHTRYEAAKSLKLKEVPAIFANHLSEDQVKAFRLIDNKTSEIAVWDMDLLAPEISALVDSGLDFKSFGWTEEEIDCLSSIVDEDCLNTPEVIEDGDGVNSAQNTSRGSSPVSKDPSSIRVAIGELNFFVPVEFYRNWAHEVRQRNNFDMAKIIEDLAGRLDMEYRPLSKSEAAEKEEPKPKPKSRRQRVSNKKSGK